MAVLHLVNHHESLSACLRVADDEDTVLLLEDGVYAAVTGSAPDRPLVALEPDVNGRGLADRLAGHVRVVTDSDFVALVAAHQPIVTWR